LTAHEREETKQKDPAKREIDVILEKKKKTK